MDIANPTSLKPPERAVGPRDIVEMALIGSITVTVLAAFRGETWIQAVRLGAISVIGGLICWACYYALCRRDTAPVIFILIVLMSSLGADPRTDGLDRRMLIVVGAAVVCCVGGAVLRFNEFRNSKSRVSRSPLRDAEVDRAASS
jgi:drug/metabolite transporter (DMT)-like permease